MRVRSKICDLCDMDGELQRAVAVYKADDGMSYFICKGHLALVKEAGLAVRWLDGEEQDDTG